MLKRIFDLIFSVLGLILLSPVFVILSLVIAISSKGGVFFLQKRVGMNNIDFILIKFRSMHAGSGKKGFLTVGNKDSRITFVGYFMRRFKLDELPQLINILTGKMSFVGPRPEVRKYVELYDNRQKQVLLVRPGLTDYASLKYIKENEILGNSDNPEQTYIDEIMPAKLELNLQYLQDKNLWLDIRLITRTILRVFS